MNSNNEELNLNEGVARFLADKIVFGGGRATAKGQFGVKL